MRSEGFISAHEGLQEPQCHAAPSEWPRVRYGGAAAGLVGDETMSNSLVRVH